MISTSNKIFPTDIINLINNEFVNEDDEICKECNDICIREENDGTCEECGECDFHDDCCLYLEYDQVLGKKGIEIYKNDYEGKTVCKTCYTILEKDLEPREDCSDLTQRTLAGKEEIVKYFGYHVCRLKNNMNLPVDWGFELLPMYNELQHSRESVNQEIKRFFILYFQNFQFNKNQVYKMWEEVVKNFKCIPYNVQTEEEKENMKPCIYGKNCYRKNKKHFLEFHHNFE